MLQYHWENLNKVKTPCMQALGDSRTKPLAESGWGRGSQLPQTAEGEGRKTGQKTYCVKKKKKDKLMIKNRVWKEMSKGGFGSHEPVLTIHSLKFRVCLSPNCSSLDVDIYCKGIQCTLKLVYTAEYIGYYLCNWNYIQDKLFNHPLEFI